MAQRGRKPEPKGVHQQRGTVQPCRDVHELVQVPDGAVLPPDGLPPRALSVWDDLAPHAIAAGSLKPADAYVFGQLCVMLANLQVAWENADADPAPASYVAQTRVLAELFGIAGHKSRVISGGALGKDGGRQNPFARNGRRGGGPA